MFHHRTPPVGRHEMNPFPPPRTTLIGCSNCIKTKSEVQVLKELLLDVLHEFGVDGDLEPKYAVLRRAQKVLGKDFPDGLYFSAVFGGGVDSES